MPKKENKLKRFARNYRNDLKEAYRIGYNQGFRDSRRIPHRVGAKTVASIGYGRGIKEYRKQY